MVKRGETLTFQSSRYGKKENMTNKKIAFKPHNTRGQEIIKILEGMGGINKYNLDGSKGIIAIDNLSTKPISNDWDYCALIMNGWKVYTLEEYEKLTKTAQNFAIDALTEKRDCYFDELDVEIVTEAYIAGCLETKPKMVNLDDVCNWVENHIFDFPWYDNEQGDFSSKDIANALRKAMEK